MDQKRTINATFINYIFLIVMLVALWMPNSYSYILSNLVYSLLRYMQYLAALVATGMVLITKKQNKLLVLNILLALILLFSTVVNHGNINKCLNYVAPMLGTVALITYYVGFGHERELLRAIRNVLTIYILINIATYFLFPKGLYVTELVTRLDDKPNTFLGNRNAYKYYGLFIILVSFLESRLDDGTVWHIEKKTVIAISLAVIMEILGGSLTGILTISFVVIYFFFGDKMLRIRNLNPKVFFYIAIALFAFITVFVAAGQYTNLIGLIFNGNITFSHRTRIWLLAQELIKNNPLLGIGTQTTEVMYAQLRNLNAHNQYLEIGLRGGLIGIFVYLSIVWIAVRRMADYRKYKIVSFTTMCIFAVMVIDMVECETYSYAMLSFFTSLAYCWRYPDEYLEPRAQKRKRIAFRLNRV